MNPRFAILLLWFSLQTLPAFSQLPEPLAEKWFSRFAGLPGKSEIPTAIACDSKGDVYVAGVVEYSNAIRGSVLKFAGESGALLWRWESTNTILPNDEGIGTSGDGRIAIAPDGNVIALFRRGNQLVKLRAQDGTQVWSVPTSVQGPTGYPSSLDYEMTVNADGDVYAVGAGAGGMAGKFRGTDGVVLWVHRPTGVTSTFARAVATNASGDVFITGNGTASNSPSSQNYTARLNGATGAVQWTRMEPAGTTYGPSGRLLQIDPNGDVVIATLDLRLLKYRGPDGGTLWEQTFPDAPYDLLTDPSGNVYLATNTRLLKADAATGTIKWNFAGYEIAPMTLLLRGNQLLAMGHLNGKLMLNSQDTQDGHLRWYQSQTSGVSIARVPNKALTLMAQQTPERFAYTGPIAGTGGGYDIGVGIFGLDPWLGQPSAVWVLPTRAQFRVDAKGYARPGTVRLEYGLTTAYGQTLQFQTNFVAPTSTYTFTLEGLADNTLYHARCVAQTDLGTAVTADFTFTTGWDWNMNSLPDAWELAIWGSNVKYPAGSDIEGDGLSLLMEYALGTNPKVHDSANALPLVFDADDRLSVTLAKRPYVSLRGEVSGDLKLWTAAEVAREDAATITLRDVVPRSGTAGRFLRVIATSQ